MLNANFAAFHRNKAGSHRKVRGESCVDFRYRNVEKWFEERRAIRTPSISTTVKPPPGLKRGSRDTDLWNKEELAIPTYNEFQFSDTDLIENTVNLLPKRWYTSKWPNGYADGIRNVWFQLPPDIEEGYCVDESDDLPLTIYESGRVALNSLPFIDLVSYDFYMTAFQEYYKMFNSCYNYN